MLDRVANRSLLEGFRRTRLKPLTQEEAKYVQGTCDFFALNSYTTSMVKHRNDIEIDTSPSWYKDTSVESFKDDSWPIGVSDWFRVNRFCFSFIYSKLKLSIPSLVANNPKITWYGSRMR